MKSNNRKSRPYFRFLTCTGIVLGLTLSFPIGSVVLGIVLGLCISFLGGIVYRRSLEGFATS